ncbi:AraC-like DNA-binding protein [Mycetocola sp. CAN_C7]|uniref:helix-turn-helix domain-containing protein n=1 Tax=Mycetocola sp. CAN_C7 TaxID=2787724 RepID=UPI0018CB3CF3
MRHILTQTGDYPVPDDFIERLASRFAVPHGVVFHFSGRQKTVGASSVLLTTQSAFRVRGDGSTLERIATDEGTLQVGFVLSNTARIGLAGGPGTLMRPGSVYAVTDWRAFDLECGESTRGLGIRLPAKRLHERGVRTRCDRFKLASQTTLGAPLRSFATAMVDPAWRPGPLSESIAERTLEDLVVGMFLETEGYAMDGEEFRSGLRGRALNLIGAKHRERGLNPEAVARGLGVSLRNLQRAFEEAGSTVVEEIGSQRAKTAALLLAAPGTRGLPIAEIAAMSGFRSSFALRAGFRSHFGMLPSEFRAAPVPLAV